MSRPEQGSPRYDGIAGAIGLLTARCSRSPDDPAAILAAVRRTAEDVFGSPAAALRLLDQTRELVPLGAESCDGALAEPRPVPVDGWPAIARALDAGTAEAAPDPPAPVRMRSPLAVPLRTGERTVGVLLLDRGEKGLDRGVLDAFGSVGGLAFSAALAHEHTARLSGLKSQFIALAAHELRAPFSVMHGIIATLHHHDDLPADQEASLRNALLDQTARTSRLLDQLLDLSRLDASSIPIERRRFRVRERLEDVIGLVAPDRREQIDLEVPDDLEVEADPAAVERIVSNLVVNALRHGSPPVTVRARQRDTHFRLSVEDRGGGVEKSFVPKLFDRFARSARSERASEGSGLGLSIAQSYAHAQGGELLYTSADPHGARFELVLPRSPEAQARSGQDTTERSASRTSSA